MSSLSGNRPRFDITVPYRILSALNWRSRGQPAHSGRRLGLSEVVRRVVIGTIPKLSMAVAQTQFPIITTWT
jgi:hypothetical protein